MKNFKLASINDKLLFVSKKRILVLLMFCSFIGLQNVNAQYSYGEATTGTLKAGYVFSKSMSYLEKYYELLNQREYLKAQAYFDNDMVISVDFDVSCGYQDVYETLFGNRLPLPRWRRFVLPIEDSEVFYCEPSSIIPDSFLPKKKRTTFND